MTETNWAPAACTLPTVEQPLRIVEFGQLFTEAINEVSRPAHNRVRLDLKPVPALAAKAADLVMRETGCCSFFTFTLTASGGALSLDIAVDLAHTDVLDALAEQANISMGGRDE